MTVTSPFPEKEKSEIQFKRALEIFDLLGIEAVCFGVLQEQEDLGGFIEFFRGVNCTLQIGSRYNRTVIGKQHGTMFISQPPDDLAQSLVARAELRH